MKKVGWIVAGVIIIGSGVLSAVLLMNKPASQTVTVPTTTESPTPDTNVTADTDDIATTEVVVVNMKNSAYTPKAITVKKGTKVTWVNQDFIQHNVVATNANNSGGLPTQNTLFGNGGSYSFTFDTPGTFAYHCAPHASFMTGTVEVIE